MIVFNHNILCSQETEAGLVLVERRKIFILYNGITSKGQAINTFGKDYRTVECFKMIVFDGNSRLAFTPMEILLLSIKFGISG